MSKTIQLRLQAAAHFPLLLQVDQITAVCIEPLGPSNGYTRVFITGGAAFYVLETFDTVSQMIRRAAEFGAEPLMAFHL